MENKTMKLTGKYIITGEIKCETGLHIGGSKTALDIGGIDLNVIKTTAGIPFIPGSSLKGKIRSLLAKEYGSEDVKKDPKVLREIFGFPPNQKDETNKEIEPDITRLIVRDSFLKNHDKMKDKVAEFAELELDYTESKWENSIKRLSGTADSPRQIERVPAGAVFSFELVYNIYSDNKKEIHLAEIKKALNLLQDDYLGGSGSRGYGKIAIGRLISEKATEKNTSDSNEVKFEYGILNAEEKIIENYKSGSKGKIEVINLN